MRPTWPKIGRRQYVAAQSAICLIGAVLMVAFLVQRRDNSRFRSFSEEGTRRVEKLRHLASLCCSAAVPQHCEG